MAASVAAMESAPVTSFKERLSGHAARVEQELRRLLDARERAGEIVRPERLLAAMRHGVLNGGKRLRPFLVIESAALFGRSGEDVLAAAAALECVHCYSLIHDDLPAMDDDDLRRGQPTVHKAYDEATAILAGDSLLTLAFDILATESGEAARPPLSPRQRLDLVKGLAVAAGIGGMAGGQALDLAAEKDRPDEAGIIRLQAMKTGALIRYACEAGAILGGATFADRERLAEFGSAIGLAFQLADDLLDLTADAAAMGKATGKDAAAGKGTLPALHGAEWTRQQLKGLVDQAHDLLEPFGAKAAALKQAATFIAERKS
ncbi:farnesyl-diphosphate synthase [Mesorhizobium australicum]|uniref:Probable farnesyl diphosphate synthase n=2 Tax=Mesorhizobium australicum TaxID=536018 RepID=A0A1X7Q1G3_9HYPH|nr:farnesyl-diphosphate synthase [Mesorhizobium australicum]